jgi:hypothetical protein
MDERRKIERFELQADTRIEVVTGDGGTNTFATTTKDISCDGAYVTTSRPLPEGAAVKLEMLLSLDMLQRIVGQKGNAKVKVKGKVIRSENGGMAIQFDKKYKIQACSNSDIY